MKKYGVVLVIASIMMLVLAIEILDSFDILILQGSSGTLMTALGAMGFTMIMNIGISRLTKMIRILFISMYSVAIVLGLIAMFFIDDFYPAKITQTTLIFLFVIYVSIFLIQDFREKKKRRA